MTVRYGAVFPQTESGSDPAAIRQFTLALEALGFDYLMAYDHVLGANPERPGGWQGPYTHRSTFHEVLVLFGWMAAFTTRLEFATGILILPQRQTALVAKQAAQVALLSGGRLRLGVGIGWNPVEYEALGQDFHSRGKRSAEQVELLRRLWTEPLVTFEGEFDRVPDAGLNPLPPRIPIWFGGNADVALRRMAALGDGWIPNAMLAEKLKPGLAQVRQFVAEAGRDPAAFGVDIRIYGARVPEGEWAREADALRELGVSHISLHTMDAGCRSLDDHLEMLRRFRAAVG